MFYVPFVQQASVALFPNPNLIVGKVTKSLSQVIQCLGKIHCLFYNYQQKIADHPDVGIRCSQLSLRGVIFLFWSFSSFELNISHSKFTLSVSKYATVLKLVGPTREKPDDQIIDGVLTIAT